MTGQAGAPVGHSAYGENQGELPETGEQDENWKLTSHNMQFRFWIACLAIVSVCLFSALVNFHFEKDSRRLAGKMQHIVSIGVGISDIVSSTFRLVEGGIENQGEHQTQLAELLTKLERRVGSLSELQRKAPTGELAELVDRLGDHVLPGFLQQVAAVEVALQNGQPGRPEVLGLARFANEEFQPLVIKSAGLIDGLKNRLKNYRIMVQGAASGIIILFVLMTIVSVFQPVDRQMRAIQKAFTAKSRELRDARDKALSAARARREFLNRISHEVRTPLNGMLATSNILAGSSLTEKQRVMSSALADTTKNLMGLLGNIVTYAELTSCNNQPVLSEVRMTEITETINGLCEERASGKCLDYSIEIDEEMPKHVLCDKHNILQVMSALIDNAFKFTEEGKITVRIWPKSTGRDMSRVTLVFCVQDTGVGIASDKQRIIFDEFTQVDNGLTRAHDGLGLGLAIASIIARNSGGQLNMTSMPGTGSSFYLELPVRTVDGLDHGPGVSRFVENRRKMNVVLVSGVEANTQALAEKLSRDRFDATITRSVQEAVELAKAANINRINIDAVIIGRDVLECDNPAFVTASLRNSLAPGAAVFGFGQWRNWYSAGIFRTANLSTLHSDLLEGILEKRERLTVTNRAA